MVLTTQSNDKAIFVDKIAYFSVKGNSLFVHLVSGEVVKYGSYHSVKETEGAINDILKRLGLKKV